MAQFNIASADPALVSLMQQEFGLPHFVAATMVAHGVASVQQAQAFLEPDLERDWRDPYEIPDMDKATDRLERAIRAGERILVFGDFDLDGISATTVLTRGLRQLGATAFPLIPKRFEEGYALTQPAITRAIDTFNPDIFVTVDCGISCAAEVESLVERGIDVVITDHHEPGDCVPQGVPVADPKCNNCESEILAGVGVALKLVQTLGGRFGMPHLWRQYTDFATLGTVADLMPLRGENRALVADGIERMNRLPRPCIAALIGVCNVAGKDLTSTNLSFSLVPRLNAAGRMGNADLALELLMTDDFEEAQAKAAELDRVNDERRAIESELAEQASAIAAATYSGQRALVVAGRGWHEGVKGIVASRLVSTYGVPSILFSIEGDEARGSGRSVGSVNLFKAVESTSDILTRFGGHEAAVGVTLPAAKLPEFTERLCAYMGQLPEDSFHPMTEIDAEVDLSELTLGNVEALNRLAPFGQDNPTPRFLARNVRLSGCRAVGADRNHLSCTLTDGASSVSGIMFHCEGIKTLMDCGSLVNAAFQVQIDEWRGRRSVKCMLNVVEPAMSCPAMRACLPEEDMDFMGELYDDESRILDTMGEWPNAATDPVRAALRERWRTEILADAVCMYGAIRREFIGMSPLYPAQAQALQSLFEGNNTLVIMGTGRGKSLIFQIHAARTALVDGKASLFIYPLRALITDQVFQLSESFKKLGLTAVALTGQSTPDEREHVYAGLRQGSVDVLLTTPEYLEFHADEIASCARIGFIAVDEAHHMVQAGANKRASYAKLSRIAQRMGNPTIVAVTATAPADVVDSARELLGVRRVVVDQFARTNLMLDDRRGLRDKDSYLASVVATGEKTLVYVNSRVGSVDVARRLRSLAPQVAMQIGFYNAGLSREERERVERLFRENVLTVLVCTSAFGEGVNIPDVRHVVHYGMPFSDIEFNQMSGRCGRDGQPAWVHLLFGKADTANNADILEQNAPRHDTMAQVYRELKALQRNADANPAGHFLHDGDIYFAIDDNQLAQVASEHAPHFGLSPEICATAVAVFVELGLVQALDAVAASGEGVRALHVAQGASRVELSDSVMYREGQDDAEMFERFSRWLMETAPDELRARIVAPIVANTDDIEGVDYV